MKGNVTPVAEFNIYVDPLAAHLVFESNLNIYLLPLDVTNSSILTKNELDQINNVQTTVAQTMHDLLVYLIKTTTASYGTTEPPVHDPCAAFFIVNPKVFEYKLLRLDVEMNKGSICYGKTVVDFYETLNDKPKNVKICLKMNVQEFWSSLIESFRKASHGSK